MDLKICKRRKRDVTAENEREHACAVKSHQCYVAETEAAVLGWVLKFPMHIIFDILSRLPMETIYSCRCVCKTFLKIVKDPYFVELYFKTPNVDQHLILYDMASSTNFLAYKSDLENPSGLSWRRFNIVPFGLYPKAHFLFSFGGSCNGLLLCQFSSGVHDAILFVCNPILGEFVILPHTRDKKFNFGAIGFCTKTKLYKVIGFFGEGMGCEIHTLGTNYWRSIENAPIPGHRAMFDSSFNGNLHYTTRSTSNSLKMICALNLETEQPHYISLPSHILQYAMKRISFVRVGALDGLFCVYYQLDRAQLEVCVMKEYGVESSWTKRFSVDLKVDFLDKTTHFIPMKMFNNGNLLVYVNYNGMLYWNFREKIYKKLSSGITFDSVLYAPSFISLRDIAGDMKVFQRNVSSQEIRKCVCGMDFFNAASWLPSPNPTQSIWKEKEVMQLLKAGHRLDLDPSGIAWEAVAEKVKTRTPDECRLKWNLMRRVGLI